jgi:Predicted membrane protein (DUF2306)
MLTVEHSAPGRVPGIASKTVLAFAALAAVVFIVVAALPYRAMLGPQDAAQQALQDFQFQYWPRRGWLLTHIACGLIALLTGPVQLWLGLHNVKMHVHRRLGLVYLAAVAIGSVAAFGLALKTDGGAVFGSGLFFLGVAWLTTTGLAYVAIRKNLIDQHREWTIRSYVVTFAFVTFRVGQVALVGRGVDLPTAIGIMAWACWAIPLLATELILQARKIAAVRA